MNRLMQLIVATGADAIAESDFNFKRLERQIAEEAALDGIYVIRTSIAKKQMTSAEAVRVTKPLRKSSARFVP